MLFSEKCIHSSYSIVVRKNDTWYEWWCIWTRISMIVIVRQTQKKLMVSCLCYYAFCCFEWLLCVFVLRYVKYVELFRGRPMFSCDLNHFLDRRFSYLLGPNKCLTYASLQNTLLMIMMWKKPCLKNSYSLKDTKNVFYLWEMSSYKNSSLTFTWLTNKRLQKNLR